MALVNFPGKKIVLSAAKEGSNTYILGSGSNMLPSAWTIQVVNNSSLSATIDVVARVDTPDANADAAPFTKTVYRKFWLNGAAGDGSLVSTQIAGATPDSLIVVPATGMQIALLVVFTSGTGTIYATPVSGPSVI